MNRTERAFVVIGTACALLSERTVWAQDAVAPPPRPAPPNPWSTTTYNESAPPAAPPAPASPVYTPPPAPPPAATIVMPPPPVTNGYPPVYPPAPTYAAPNNPLLAEPQAAPSRPPAEDPGSKGDSVRIRGGFSVNGGAMFLPGTSAMPAASLALRLGVQFNNYFGIVYQNTGMGVLTVQTSTLGASYQAGFADYNSFLAMLSISHVLDLAVGPSIDYLTIHDASLGLVTGSTSSGFSEVSSGMHGRLAIDVGAFSLGFDVHPIFLSAGTAVSLTGGIGGEWY